MDISQIANVIVYEFYGVKIYEVLRIDNVTMWVPDDPNNRDWSAVQEWLAINGGN